MSTPAEAIRDAEGRKATTISARAKRLAMFSRIPFAILVVLMLLTQIGPRPDPTTLTAPPDLTEALGEADAANRHLYFVRGGAAGYAPEGSSNAIKIAGSGSVTVQTDEYEFEKPDGIWIDLRVTKGSKSDARLVAYSSEKVVSTGGEFQTPAGNTYNDGDKISTIEAEDANDIPVNNEFVSPVTQQDFEVAFFTAPTLDYLLLEESDINNSLLILSIQDTGDTGVKAAQVLADLLFTISEDQLEAGEETTVCDRILIHAVEQSSMDAFRAADGCPTATIMTSDEATAYSTWVDRRLDKWWFSPQTKFIMPNIVDGASTGDGFYSEGMTKAVTAREQVSISAPCVDVTCLEGHEGKAVDIVIIDWEADLSAVIPLKEAE